MQDFVDWSSVEAFSIIEAACLLTATSPDNYRHRYDRVLPPNVDGVLALLKRAIKVGGLRPIELRILMRDGSCELVDASQPPAATDIVHASTMVERMELLAWCKANHKPWPFPEDVVTGCAATARDYPEELRAAIEAFEAVSSNSALTAKNTPKAAITAWLAANKPELSGNARERIATVANWQPAGGAPKTPG